MATKIVVQGPDDVVLQFARHEMARYGGRLSGHEVEPGEPEGRENLFLRVDPSAGAGDAFQLRSGPEGLVIAAAASRGVLYGVYAYLESLGARFPFPGEKHEVLPRRDLAFEGYDRREEPSFARRGMTFSGDRQHALGWIDFCGKQRLNWVFHHTQFSEVWWNENRDAIWPELQKRGISLELGGHYLPHFIPREMFAEHPEWFRVVDGARTNDTNLCPSSREAMEYLQERVRQYVRAMPEADVYNVWADDTAEDASTWCACEACHGYSPSDQNLLVMNAMARAVRDIKPGAKIVHIAYHETIAPPEKVEPDPDVVMMWAPRERCYAHALDDPNCAKNRQHARWLEALVKVFDPGQAEVFEYYPDQVVFNHMMPALADTIAGDARYYKSLGIGLLEPLLTPYTHPWISPPTAAILQSRVQWNLDADLHEVLNDYARTYFGSEEMVRYYAHRERALHHTIKACDFDHPVAAFWTPPLDKPEVTARHLQGLEVALEELYHARQTLAGVGHLATGAYMERVAKEEEALDLAGRRINGQMHFARGVLAYNRFQETHSPEDAREAIRYLEHAYADLNEIRVRDDQVWRTFSVAQTLIQRVRAELGEARATASAAEIMAQLAGAFIPEQGAEMAGLFSLRLDGEGGGEWTLEITPDGCRVVAGSEGSPTATLQMQAADFVSVMGGELPARAVIARGAVRLTGDAVRLMRLPQAFRLAISPGI